MTVFITVEGKRGAGMTTTAKFLAKTLRDTGATVYVHNGARPTSFGTMNVLALDKFNVAIRGAHFVIFDKTGWS